MATASSADQAEVRGRVRMALARPCVPRAAHSQGLLHRERERIVPGPMISHAAPGVGRSAWARPGRWESGNDTVAGAPSSGRQPPLASSLCRTGPPARSRPPRAACQSAAEGRRAAACSWICSAGLGHSPQVAGGARPRRSCGCPAATGSAQALQRTAPEQATAMVLGWPVLRRSSLRTAGLELQCCRLAPGPNPAGRLLAGWLRSRQEVLGPSSILLTLVGLGFAAYAPRKTGCFLAGEGQGLVAAVAC